MEVTDTDIDQFMSLKYSERKEYLLESYRISKNLAAYISKPIPNHEKDFLMKTVAILLKITENAEIDDDDWAVKDDKQHKIMELILLLEKKIRNDFSDILSIYLYLRMIVIYLSREAFTGSNMREIDLNVDEVIDAVTKFINTGEYHDPATDKE